MFSRAGHDLLRDSVNSIGTPLTLCELHAENQFTIVSCNEMIKDIVELSAASLIDKQLSEIFPTYLHEALSKACSEAIDSQESQDIEISINRLSSNRWWRCLISPILKKDLAVTRVLITYIEITDEKILSKELERSNSRFRAIVTSAYDGIISIDSNEKILLANNAAKEIFDRTDLVGLQLKKLVPKKFRSRHSEYISGFRHSDIPSRPMHLRANVEGVKPDGSSVPLEVTIAKITVDGDTEMTAVIRDITEKAKLLDELNQQAMEDNLTSLNNRRYTLPLLTKELERAKRYNNPLSVLFIDIDHFKSINDSHGHLFGDQVLQQLASLLKQHSRALDITCGWGGEEFLLVLPETTLPQAQEVAEKFRVLTESLSFVSASNEPVHVTISVGVTWVQPNVETVDQLITRADENLYLAKDKGRNTVVAN